MPPPSMGFLTEAVERARRECRENPPSPPADAHRARTPLDLEAALRRPGMALIAEVKRSSPSAGAIADPATDAARTAAAYAAGGAAAVSVLTDATHFGGSLDDLRAVRAAIALPILRKDFIVDPRQIVEARAAGADAVLLIATALNDAELADLAAAAASEGVAALVETHSERDVERALATGARIVGVNSRDLDSLRVDIDRALTVLARLPDSVVRVLESGVATAADVRRANDAGADAVLVGEVLMRSTDPTSKIRELLGR